MWNMREINKKINIKTKSTKKYSFGKTTQKKKEKCNQHLLYSMYVMYESNFVFDDLLAEVHA